jgi:hypothetical protein
MTTPFPIYQIKANIFSVSGIQLSLEDGSIDANGFSLSKTGLVYENGNASNTFNTSTIALVNVSNKNTLTAGSSKVSNLANTKSVECKEDGIVIRENASSVSFSAESLNYGASSATWANIILNNTGVDDLASVLTLGNIASRNIDMSNYNISNCSNLEVSTINGSAYPLPVSTLDQVLTAGNIASRNIDMSNYNISNCSNLEVSTINGGVYPPVIPIPPLADVLQISNNAGTNNLDMNGNNINNVNQMTSETVSKKNTFTADSIKVSNQANTKYVECKEDEIVIHDNASSVTFSAESLTYGASSATWENIILNNTGTDDLIAVLNRGNIASLNIDMSGNNISRCGNLEVSTINGSAYPPLNNLQQVLTAGNSTFNSTILMESNSTGVATSVSTTGYSIDLVSPTNQLGIQATDITIRLNSGGGVDLKGLGEVDIQSKRVGYTTDYNLILENTNTGTGNTSGVPSMAFYKSGRNSSTGDIIGSHHYQAKNGSGVKTEFAKVEASVQNTGLNDGAITISCLENGVMTPFLNINGGDQEINALKNIDMSGNNILRCDNLNVSTINNSVYPPVVSIPLADVLQVNNNAGTNSIDMNTQDILNCNNLQVSTINGSVYPPVVPPDTLQQVLTTSNITDQQIIFRTDPLISQLTLNNTSSELLFNYENFTSGGFSGSKSTYITTQQMKEQLFINGGGVYNVATMEIDGDPVNDPTNLKSQVVLLEEESTSGKNVSTVYRPVGITQSNYGNTSSNFTVTTDHQFIVNSDNFNVAAESLTIPKIGEPITAQLRKDGLTMIDTISGWNSWYRKSSAYVSNLAGTISTQISNNVITLTNLTGNTLSISNTDITHINNSSRDLGITSNQNITMSADNIDISPTRMIFPSPVVPSFFDYNSATGNYLMKTNAVGHTTDQMLSLENTNTSAGTTTGVPSISHYKSGRNAGVGDIVSSVQHYAKNYLGVKTLFSKTETVVTSSSAGSGDDSALDFYTCVNGSTALVMRLNGADNENNNFRPLDMNGNNIRTSTGNMTIDTSSSSGTGILTLATKDGTAGSGGGLIFTGNTLLSGSAGGNSGQHLCITINASVYKIALLNA